MAIKLYKPVTPGFRGKANPDKKELTKKDPEKTLMKGIKRSSGRDGQGRIAVRRKGGGAKRKYRMVDFKRQKTEIKGLVKAVEYDPNRSAHLALIHYLDGEKSYIIWPEGLEIGTFIENGPGLKTAVGNHMPLSEINPGSFIHNIEIKPGKGGQIIRSAGTFGKLLGRDGDYVSIELPSGEVRAVLGKCFATVGVVGNRDYKNIKGGKAGWSRHLGRRPKVRGVVMNPVDHPMGGGEGRTSGGRHPCSPTGKLAKGLLTRKKKKYSNRFIIRKRKAKRNA